jgi:hypothetical protein
VSDDDTPEFTSRPDTDDAPDACQWEGCDDPPTQYIRFAEDPCGYMCYCHDHQQEAYARNDDAKATGQIR